MKRARRSCGWRIGTRWTRTSIYETWPAWMLNAAIEGPNAGRLPLDDESDAGLARRLQAPSGQREHETIGTLRNPVQDTSGAGRRVGSAGNGGGALSQLNMLAAMALRQGRN